jgi:hypothetical protein
VARDTITGILVTPEGVEWATLQQSKGGADVVASDRVAVPSVSEDSSSEGEGDSGVVAESIEAIKTPVVLALPSTQLLLRVLDLPAVDADELTEMVELQVDKYSPFPIDQMVVSHEVLTQDAQNCTVLVAAAKLSAVDEIGDMLKQHGLRIERVDVALLGRWKSMVETGQVATTGRETLVIVADESIEILTHDAGTLIALSCLGKAPNLDDPITAADIAQEIAHFLVGLEVERGRAEVQAITLWSACDSPAFVEALTEACQQHVGERSLVVLSPVSHGIALRALGDGTFLDLTPDPWRDALSSSRFRRNMLFSVFGLLGLWLLFVGGALGWFAFEKMRINRLKAEDVRWMEPANEVRRLRLQVNMIERYTDQTYSALECLREISQRQPTGVDLTSFTYRKGEGMDLDGEADRGSLVNRFNEALNQSELFSEVRPGTRSLTKRGRYRFSFDIEFPEVPE